MIIPIIRAVSFTYLIIRVPIVFMDGPSLIAWIGTAGIFFFVITLFWEARS